MVHYSNIKHKAETKWLIYGAATLFVPFLLLVFGVIPAGIFAIIFGVASVGIVSFFISVVFSSASTFKCPHCGKTLTLGFDMNKPGGFVLPEICLFCGKSLNHDT